MIKRNVTLGILFLLILVLSGLFVNNYHKIEEYKMAHDDYELAFEFYQLKSEADSLLNRNSYDNAFTLYKQLDSLTNDEQYTKFANEIYEERNQNSQNYALLYDNLSKRSRQIRHLRNNTQELDDSLKNVKSTLDVLKVEFDSIFVHSINIDERIKQLSDSINSISTNDTLTIINGDGVVIKFLGETIKGYANGYGYAIFDNKSYYEGNWKNNQRNGRGKYYWQNGDYYDGEYKNDLRNGYGTYYFESGEQYIGDWKNDLRHGNGVLLNADGKQLYNGKWKSNKPSKKQGKGLR